MPTHRFDLTGKTALITGSAGFLGFEHAAALLECDASVVLTDISLQALVKAKERLLLYFPKSKILHHVMDVSDQDSVKHLNEILFDEKIMIDILINNAAINPRVSGEMGVLETSRLESFPLDQWDLQLAVGLTGAFICSKIFGDQMSKYSESGVILNISSDLSVSSPDQRLYEKNGLSDSMQPVKPVTYSVVKAGLIGLTLYLATYWADKGVRCNALSPGGVFNGQGDEFVRRLSSRIPMGRMANKDEYRAAIQFLCSDASSYMNGQNIVIDGGRSVW